MKYSWIILLFLCSCYLIEDLPPDQDIWEYDLPLNQGFVQDNLLLLNSRLNDDEFQFIEGLSIVKNDHLIFENYYAKNVDRFYSKNLGRTGLIVTLAALGIAIDTRHLSVEDSIYKFLPEYENIFDADPRKRGIRIRDVLTHKTGLAWNESIEPLYEFANDTFVENPDNNLIQMKRSPDWVSYVLSKPEVGVGFYSYNTANGVLLAKIIENATGQDFNSYIQAELFKPMEINHHTIRTDDAGNANGGDGYSLSLLDLTKIGYLYLNEGIWKGRTLLNSNFVKDAFTRQANISQSGFQNSIGYFWTFFGESYQNVLGTDYHSIVFLFGELGQTLFIVPEEKMVVTILSDNYFSFRFQSVNLFGEITRSLSN